MDRTPLQLALRELQAALKSRPTRIGLIIAVALLGLGGPFGTFSSFNPGQRLVYWAVMVAATYLVGQAAMTFFSAMLRGQITQRWPRVIVSGLFASLPVTAVVILVNGVAYRHLDASTSLTIWLYTTIIVLVVVVAMVTARDMMGPAGPRAEDAAASGPTGSSAMPTDVASDVPGTAAILERVPLPQRGRLLALSVEDHYVDIITDKGKALVLMRLADAMREAAPVTGLQIHRSHWVALAAVSKTHRSAGKVTLELSNGISLPVSRGFLPAVKAAGLG